MAPVLIGASGRVGRRIARVWRRDSRPFAAVSRAAGGTALWNMERTPPPPLPEAEGEAVVVLSGSVPGPGADLGANLAFARRGVDAARAWGAAHCFVVSSSAVYGPTGPSGAGEDAALAGASAYAGAKIEMERAVGGTGVTVLRLANVAGASQPFLALDGGGTPSLDRFADGLGPSRSFVGPVALAGLLAVLCDRARRGGALPPVLNFAGPRPVAMADIFRAAGRDVVWRTPPTDAVQHVHLDVGRLVRLLAEDAGVSAAHATLAEAYAAPPGPLEAAARLLAEARATEDAA